jgi:hypothetical protein
MKPRVALIVACVTYPYFVQPLATEVDPRRNTTRRFLYDALEHR